MDVSEINKENISPNISSKIATMNSSWEDNNTLKQSLRSEKPHAKSTESAYSSDAVQIGVLNRHHANMFLLIAENNLERLLKDQESLWDFVDILGTLSHFFESICPLQTIKTFDSFLLKIWKKLLMAMRSRRARTGPKATHSS